MSNTTETTQHTPGPWYFFTNRHRTREGEDWGSVDHKPHPAMGAPTPLPGVDCTWHGARGKANALLMSAAPVLLEVVQEALNNCSIDNHGGADDSDCPFCRKARDAIWKAGVR